MRLTYLTTAALAALALPALADDAVTIKLKHHPSPGQSIHSSSVHTDKGSTRIEGPDDKLLLETKPEGSETVDRMTVLEADKDGRPTKYLRTFEKATETADGKTKTYTYQGRTVLYEKQKDGKFRVGVVGKGEIDSKDAERLYDKANKPDEGDELMKQFAPNKPVKAGDSWTIDIKPVAAALDMKADVSKSSGTVKLVKVATRGKAPVGTFEVDVKLAVTGGSGKIDMAFDPPATATMKGTIELVIDGTSTETTGDLELGMTGTGTWKNAGGAGGKVVFDVSSKVKGHDSAEEPARDAKAPAVTWLKGPGEWQAFKPKDGSFTADFPAAPQQQEQKNPRGDKTITWTAGTDGGAVAYVVSTTDFAGADPSKINPKTVLDAVAQNQKGAQAVKDVKQNGHPGVEFHREDRINGKEAEFRHKVVMVNGRMFQQIVIAEKGKLKPDLAERFFKSLKITAKPMPKDD